MMKLDTQSNRQVEIESNNSNSNAAFNQAFNLFISKTRINIRRLADEPKSAAWAADGNYFNFKEGFHEIGNWTSSFFTGMALLAWQATEDEYFLQQLLRLAPAYHQKAFNPAFHSHHDMGFLYSLYSVALYKLTGDREHREVGLQAAEALAGRFNPQGNFIRAWGSMNTDEHENMAIIDCLMNLPLLFWATQESGDGKFRNIAVRHADICLKHFIRPDNSVCHAFRFDLKTGEPLGQDNYCGFAKDSYWARGATWAIYGLALSHRYTGAAKYLDASRRVAKQFLAQLDEEIVPIWDFKLTPEATHIRDSSAAAIAVCGFQELSRLGAADAEIQRAKDALLRRLCREDYLEFDQNCPGILRKAQVNPSGPGTASNVFTSWGDYFLMEALAVELFGMKLFW